MRLIKIPSVIVTQVMLTYRYVTLLLSEAGRITQAYALRAPNQKGINIKNWGSLLGHLLLRTIDRADEIYNGHASAWLQWRFSKPRRQEKQ